MQDERTVRVRGRDAALVKDALPVRMRSLKITCVREPDDHVVLDEEPALRLPVLHALKRVEHDLRRVIDVVDLVHFAETTECADESSQDDRTGIDTPVRTGLESLVRCENRAPITTGEELAYRLAVCGVDTTGGDGVQWGTGDLF